MKKHYTPEIERILKEEAEKAECMSILHILSSRKYINLSKWINIPIIILSAFCGAINFADFTSYFKFMNLILGTISIFVAILNAIENYLGYAKLGEIHKIISKNYEKINGFIKTELAIEKECRQDPDMLLNTINHEIENIKNSEPIIPDEIIKIFNEKYGNYENISKPSMCNGLTEVRININSINKFIEKAKSEHSLNRMNSPTD